ncbi:MAG: Jag N-terminal domain-containing protein [Candidatus Omnitrophota bacterium]
MKDRKQKLQLSQDTIEVEARTATEAIKIALDKLGIDRVDADIKVLREENKGLFSMNGSKLAKVRATKKLNK